jgi:thiol-disulfide isomerase/thioredoxin
VAKPIVDGLENKLEGQANVVRLDIMSSLGRQAAGHFGVRGLPTLLLVDGNGEVVLSQVGIIRSGPVQDSVEQLVVAK